MTQHLQEPALDLDAYFDRIGYRGERAPTLEALGAIQARHAETIPFENITPLLGRPVRLDLASLQQKLVADGRGGYCFEQNLLLHAALRALGFQVTCLAARVVWNAPESAITPRSHMLLRVDIDRQPYIVDVGFGGVTPTAPLALVADREQATPHEPFRLVARGDAYLMQALIEQEWRPLYRFDLQEQQLVDYEVSNWYVSTHPQSHFVTGLSAARPDRGRRYALRNTQYSMHDLRGGTERRALGSVAELRAALETSFRIRLPETPDLDRLLQRLVDQGG